MHWVTKQWEHINRFSIVKHLASVQSFGIRKILSMLRMNSINICFYLIFTVQGTNITYEVFNLCVTVPSRFQKNACNFIEKETLAQVFPVKFAKFLRTPSPTERLRWLLLFLILLNAFRPSGLQVWERETPSLVLQNQPFVDPLQNRS